MKNIFNIKIFNIFFLVLIVLLPLQTRYFLVTENIRSNFFEYGSISLYAVDLVFLLFVIYGILYSIKNKVKFNVKSLVLLSLLILFNIAVGVSVYFSIDKAVSICAFMKILLLSSFSYLIYINKISLNWFANSFIISGTIQAFLSIYQFIMQSIEANKYLGIAEHLSTTLGTYVIEGSFGRVLKSYGLFPHPNMLGLFLLITLIFILFKIVEHKRNNDLLQNKSIDLKMIYLVYLFGINLTGLLFTFSRISIGLFMLSFISFLIYEISLYFKNINTTKKINYNIKIFSFLIFIILILGLSSSDMLASRVDAKNRLVEKSTNERMSQIDDFTKYISSNYLEGVGIGAYTIYKYNQNRDLNTWDLQPIHNIYLMILIETGILGLIFFVSLPIFKLITNREMKIILPLLSILLFGLFDHFIVTLGFGLILFFLFLGIEKEEKYDRI